MPTGIFFHYQQGERLRDFPQALDKILEKDHVFLYDALYPSKPRSSFDLEPIPQETLHKVHSPEMVDRVKATGNYEGALYSAAGTVAAATKIWSGEITNAFVFTGYGDHHAGSTFFGGGCYFNGAALAIHELHEKHGVKGYAIIDTDAHHGNGTWKLFENNLEVLYLCFCSGASRENNQNVNIHVAPRVTDCDYLTLAKEAFQKWITEFQPEIIFWNWGYDGTIGEYGDIGLIPDAHLKLAMEIKKVAQQVCRDRLIVILCGGSRRDLALFLIPRIITILID
jgi:acetoin utilization deacetylase AcuC-like enzyme